ncbi:MAG: CHAT domain-containing protein [Candidatus Koribacter versatilis]|nr:CHAT domain-containing protein [Candidatus Koribacter versatilis]
MDRQFGISGSGQGSTRQPECPEPFVWYEIAGGTITPEQAQEYFQHVSGCNHCGALLQQAVSDLNEETTDSETNQIAALESARLEWQRRLARQITGRITSDDAPVSWWLRWRTVPRLALVTTGLVVVAIGGYRIGFQQSQMQLAEKLLARAYTEQRTVPLRMAGAEYAPLGEGVQRGSESSFLGRPETLLKAEPLIAEQLASHPSDPRWLQAKARADLLEGKYEGAVESLRRALQLAPKSPEILTDLATAYFQRKDYGAAFESLSQVLAQRPDDPVALFNRAIVAEQLHLYRQALDDAERYLQVDPHSQWAVEASARVDSIRAKLKEHDQSHAMPLLSPAQLVMSAGNPSHVSGIDQRIEEYLHDAVSSWLPRAYPETASAADPSAKQALFFLADLTSQQHNDRWPADLLRGSSSANFPQAVAALARATHANEAGEYDAASEQSARAHRLFSASGNVAGALRAQFEQIFAAQIKRQSETCRRQATAALAESERYPYPGLQIQLGLEKGVCSFLMGDIGADERASQRAMDRAEEHGYGALFLRAVSFRAADELATGDQSGAWKRASAGLERYWAGEFPVRRGFGLYEELAYTAEAAGRSNLQVAIWREAVALIDSDKEILLRAMAHDSMANAATAAHQPQVAGQQYAEAARLFTLAPRTEASRSDALYNEIQTAQLEARQGEFDKAIARLTSIQDQVRPLPNNYLVGMFYSTLGELQLRSHREVDAEHALRSALALAEQNLESLRSEAERMSWSKGAAPVYLALSEAELAQGRTLESLEMYEWYLGASQRAGTNPHSRRPMKNPPLPVPPGLASRLPLLSRETVLAYGLLPGGLAIWIYDDRGVSAQWFPKSTQDLQELAARFSDLSSDPKSELSALRRDAHSLYESLIAPVEQRLVPGRTLAVEAEGPLARVPFEALLDSNGHYLVERWPIVDSLGQDSDARLRNVGPISADLPAVVVGSTASSPAEGLIPLPDVAAEADVVASGFYSASVLKGENATLNAVRSELPAAAVFHFAGHSLSTPDKIGLMLADGDSRSDTSLLLEADGLRRLKLARMQLAVLSACSTAAGSGGSSGFNSITEALLRAGVPHVVASRWAVDSVEARAFVEDFYRNALSGQSVSDAIRLTSRKMLSNPRTAHPYYWSAFAAYGRP